MSRTPYDSFAKDLALAVLSPLGTAESDARIASDPQFTDLRFVGDPAPPAGRSRSDLLARMAKGQALFEFAHLPPDLAEMASWQRKQLAWFQALINEARRSDTPPPAAPPVAWGLSSGRPTLAMRAYRLRPMRGGWPAGCYQGTPADTFRLVVISELPRTRDTLLVRVMGAGVTFREAMDDLDALPRDASERTLVGVALTQLRLQLREDPNDEAQEILMQTRKLAEEMWQQQLERGVALGIEQGIARGRQEAIERGRQEAASSLRESISLALSARQMPLSEHHRAQLDAEPRIDVLQRWLVRAITAPTADDVFAT